MPRGLAVVAAALVACAAPAVAQKGDVQQQLERAGRLFEMGNSAGLAGNRDAEIAAYRDALELVDAVAAGLEEPRRDVLFGRREMQLSLADAYLAAHRHAEALALLQRMVDEQVGADVEGADRQARLHLARTLRAAVSAAFGAGAYPEGRAALARLVLLGRSMQADEPANTYLIRTLARDLEGETIVRFILGDGDGSRAAAAETLDLFRTLVEINPLSPDARRGQFLWAWFAGGLEDDRALFEEAVRAGEWLEAQGEMRPEHGVFLRNARVRLGR